MPVTPAIAFRLEPELIEQLDHEAELRGHTRSSLAKGYGMILSTGSMFAYSSSPTALRRARGRDVPSCARSHRGGA
jgi:hypothetical protein